MATISFTDFRNIKRGIFLMVLIGASLSYIQLVAVEQRDKFAQFRLRISQAMRLSGGQTTPAIDLIYYDYNETESAINLHDVYNVNSPDVYHDEADEDEDDEIDNETNETVSEKETPGHAKKQNRFSTIKLRRLIQNETDFTKKPLMVLFSSWIANREKARVYATLRRLWNAWPSIKPVVVTKDQAVQKECKRDGWDFQPTTSSNSRCFGPPILSTLFMDVFKSHDAYFYGYSNADIIFGDGLEKTMKFLYNYFGPWKTKPMLVVGRRHNVDFIKHENFTLQTPSDVSKLTRHGKLVIRSTDYFFTNRHFPWGQAPKVTIGRPFVVRAIIGWALQKGYYVIDATRTIESVHLTTQDGVFASWHKKGTMCNERVLALLRWSIPTSYGHCECAKIETFYGQNNNIEMRHRPMNRKYCGR